MKRKAIIFVVGSMVAAGSAFAAMGPMMGLPQGWSITNTRGYGTQAGINGNPASAMCVECHTVNPSDRVLGVSTNGAAVVVDTTAPNRGSHFVMNVQAGAANAPWGTTSTGGGFDGGFGGAANQPRDAGQYLRNAAWLSGATSKFQGAAGSLSSVLEGGAGYADNAVDMICESCHNLIVNTVNGAADNDLLVGTYQDNVNDSLCTGCHAQSEVAAGRQAFHGNDNLLNFRGNARKNHHVMTGDALNAADYPADGVSGSMWAPSASDRLSATWCATPFASGVTPTNLDLATGEAISFRDMCNAAGSGTRAYTAAVGLGDISPTGAGAINCSNCHRPHNARANSGAFIFRMGDPSKGNYDDGQATPAANVGTGNFNGLTDASLYFGLRRQHDVDSGYATKVYTEYRPLCAGCHQGY